MFFHQNSSFASEGKVAATLIQLLPVLTDLEQIGRILRFANSNGIGTNEQLLDASRNARFNLQWAAKNLPIIKNVVQKMDSIVK